MSNTNQAGKGDKARPCDPVKMREGWDRIWGNKTTPAPAPTSPPTTPAPVKDV
jgi:hypothetical protein